MVSMNPFVFVAFLAATYYAIRVAGFIAHFIVLIYELATQPWDSIASSLMIATVVFLIACIVMAYAIMSSSDDHKTELQKARVSFFASLSQAAGIVGLFVVYVIAVKQRQTALLAVHALNVVLSSIALGLNGATYHKGRLAGPNSSFHIPFDALVAGDLARMRAARPDYTRKPRKTKKDMTNIEGNDGNVRGEDEGAMADSSSQANTKKFGPADGLVITSDGNFLSGPPGEDERRWWEKW